MKKLAILFLTLIFSTLNIQAKVQKSDFTGILRDFGVEKGSVAISIKDAKSGNVVYELNETTLMNPASVQKILTMPAAAYKLGKDYKFKTELYSRGEDSYVIKLGADPYLKSGDLKTLVNPVKVDTNQIYIDSSILDDKTWGEGWQWDDDMNILMPRFGAYNLDRNLIKLTVMPSENGQYAKILNPSKYPLVFYNNVTTSNNTSLNVERNSSISANTITLSGTIARQTTVQIPNNNLKRYFEVQLTRALENHKVYIKNPYKQSKVLSNDILKETVEHSLDTALNDILKNSNNMAAESVFKLAGEGTDVGGIQVFKNFCKNNGIDDSMIRLTDGSGVSKNNLVNADFVSEYLYLNKDNYVMEYLPKPGEGTLTQRMLPLKYSLQAKTGTLSGVSAIAGYLTSKNGHKYVFCIIQNDVKLSDADKKMLEDHIIREAYLKL